MGQQAREQAFLSQKSGYPIRIHVADETRFASDVYFYMLYGQLLMLEKSITFFM